MASNDPPICWICREEVGDDGIRACACTGEMEHVHAECLGRWLTVSRNSACQLCRVVYNTRMSWTPVRDMVFCPPMEVWEMFEMGLLLVGIPTLFCAMVLTVGVVLYVVNADEALISSRDALMYYIFFVVFEIICLFGLGFILYVTRHFSRVFMAANTRVEVFPYWPAGAGGRLRGPADDIELVEIARPDPRDEQEHPGDAAGNSEEGGDSSNDEGDVVDGLLGRNSRGTKKK
ncbi:RF3 [Retroperitoneal fibromatosis-associated herpesvirus]|uniref:BHV4-IE1-like protein n=1 Tax=Retroperitoneal fibromatosis-associated herpesvirus TaxID=111469 RepID=A9JPH6_9GAMA|nr:RF3 [Retroperitoneal fibromatosis-associated herpesvirus]ABX74966.1 BHV4-IE1-like protein [Retroperitoneal fibromatosis-associated herpesvirus]AGY30692.1 RF3 [Retroperitoneal fibromatosis-associated herpesvirus]